MIRGNAESNKVCLEQNVDRMDQSTNTYSVLFAHTASVLQITRPRQAKSSHLEVSVGEHVRQTERIVVFLCNRIDRILIGYFDCFNDFF